jgi:predicted Zn-dependent protease
VAGILAAGGWVYFETVIAPLLARFYSVAARDVATETGDLETAARLYRKAVRWEPDQPWNLAALGLVRLDQGNPAGLQRIRQAVALHPRSASLQASLARAYERLGMPNEALQALHRAVELHPLDPTHRMDLAEALLARERPQEAAAQLAAARQVPLLPEQEQRLEALESRVNSPIQIRQ